MKKGGGDCPLDPSQPKAQPNQSVKPAYLYYICSHHEEPEHRDQIFICVSERSYYSSRLLVNSRPNAQALHTERVILTIVCANPKLMRSKAAMKAPIINISVKVSNATAFHVLFLQYHSVSPMLQHFKKSNDDPTIKSA